MGNLQAQSAGEFRWCCWRVYLVSPWLPLSFLWCVMCQVAEQDFFKAQRGSWGCSHAGLGQECDADWCDA